MSNEQDPLPPPPVSMTPASDPTQARYLSSYMARRTYAEEVQRPPAVSGVMGAIDIHCHAHEGQQDALALAKHASANGMKAILYKSISNPPGAQRGTGIVRAAESARMMQNMVEDWCEEMKVAEPTTMKAGWCIARGKKPPSAETTRAQMDDGIVAVWMPVAMHANTLSKVGGKPMWWGEGTDPLENTDPIPWEEALKIGHYLLDGKGRLKPEIKEIFRMIADKNLAVFFGHSTHPEIFQMAEEVDKLGIKKAVVDHPFSPFVDLTLEQMRELTSLGIYMNFTYDEISPLLGVDPARMCKTIQALGTDYVTLSSDAGEPLFPNTVECMRMIRGYMRAFGLSEPEVHKISSINPEKIMTI
ncbi:MAG: DUF6282 family protein [Xanthobacteraceae bacterium]